MMLLNNKKNSEHNFNHLSGVGKNKIICDMISLDYKKNVNVSK